MIKSGGCLDEIINLSYVPFSELVTVVIADILLYVSRHAIPDGCRYGGISHECALWTVHHRLIL
jgi:hypothetical protein